MDAETIDAAHTLVDAAIGSAALLQALADDGEVGAALRVVARTLEDAAHELRDAISA